MAHPKSLLTETVTLVDIEDSHSMVEVDKAVTQTAPDAESRLEPTPTREQTVLGRRSAAVAQNQLVLHHYSAAFCKTGYASLFGEQNIELNIEMFRPQSSK